MPDGVENPEVASALDELQEYLADKVAPLMVTDSMEILIKQPPELVASAIRSWATIQSRMERSVSFSDYLYHGVVKIHMMQEYKLLPPEEFRPFLDRLKPAILSYCPQEERPFLEANLQSLGAVAHSGTPSQVEVIFRATSGAPESRHPKEPAEALKKLDVQRFSQLIRRLEKRLSGMGLATESTAPQSSEELVTEALVEAARSASETV